MAEDTREISTTTAGLWPEATVSDLNDDSCWLYLMKGLGSDRDDNISSADGFVKQAPNTVRRYVYKGSTTGWVCLY